MKIAQFPPAGFEVFRSSWPTNNYVARISIHVKILEKKNTFPCVRARRLLEWPSVSPIIAVRSKSRAAVELKENSSQLQACKQQAN